MPTNTQYPQAGTSAIPKVDLAAVSPTGAGTAPKYTEDRIRELIQLEDKGVKLTSESRALIRDYLIG